MALSVADARRQCQQFGLPHNGSKAELMARIAAHNKNKEKGTLVLNLLTQSAEAAKCASSGHCVLPEDEENSRHQDAEEKEDVDVDMDAEKVVEKEARDVAQAAQKSEEVVQQDDEVEEEEEEVAEQQQQQNPHQNMDMEGDEDQQKEGVEEQKQEEQDEQQTEAQNKDVQMEDDQQKEGVRSIDGGAIQEGPHTNDVDSAFFDSEFFNVNHATFDAIGFCQRVAAQAASGTKVALRVDDASLIDCLSDDDDDEREIALEHLDSRHSWIRFVSLVIGG